MTDLQHHSCKKSAIKFKKEFDSFLSLTIYPMVSEPDEISFTTVSFNNALITGGNYYLQFEKILPSIR